MNLQLRDITSKLSTRGWITVGGAALAGVIFIYLLMSLASSPSYQTLVAGESPSQAGKVTAALATAGIPYQLSNDGTAVSVESDKVSQARVVLDQQGLLLGTGTANSLESYLGKSSLGESNFQQEQQNTSALEQQLDQTIEGMNGINSAQVQLAIPDQTVNLFSGTSTQPTASVLLNTNQTLGQSAVRSIAGLIAGTVPGLGQGKVTITDQNGDLLWPSSANADLGSSLTAKQSAENAYDTQVADEVDAMLASTLGPGKALVKINADLDANQEKVASVKYGKTGTPYQANLTNESLKGTGTATPSGAAGNTSTNLSTYAGANGGNSNYKNHTSNSAYDVNKTVTQATIAPGNVNRQSVSVLVNSTVPASELPTIRAAVQNAVGYNAKRGDTLSIGSLPFAKLPVAAASSSSSKPLSDVKYVLVGIGALAFVAFMSRLLRRRETEQFAGQPTWLRELEMPRSLSQLEAQTHMVDLEPPTMVARLRPPVNVARQQVEELVDRDPERVAAQIRQWMTED
jgi:flagellar M-ring protein FliF